MKSIAGKWSGIRRLYILVRPVSRTRLPFITNALQLHYIYLSCEANMPPLKTSTLNLRVDPAIKEAVREAALRDNRSIANMIEVLIRQHCAEAGIPIPEQQSLFNEENADG